MPSEETSYKLRELIAEGWLEIGDGYRAKNSELGSTGIPFARAANINDGFHFDGADCFPVENLSRVGNKASLTNDVVFTSKGTVGRLGFVSASMPRFVYSPQLCFWRALDLNEIDPVFLFYWLQGHEATAQFSYLKGQTDMADYVSLRDQREMTITLPPIERQQSIAAVLGILDQRIESLRRMAGILEAMARAIFKSWFVDFDPVKAKAEGREPEGMDAVTAALFASDFQDSELGSIPRGWKTGRLDDLLVLQRGFDLPHSHRREGDYPVVAASGPNGSHNEYKVKGPGVVTGRSGVLGNVFYVHEDFWPLNTTLWVKEFRVATPSYALRVLERIGFEGFNAGSAVPTLNRNHVHGLRMLIPPTDIVTKFDELATILHQKSKAADEQRGTLTALRDALLPRLISGKLRVPEAEEMLAEVV